MVAGLKTNAAFLIALAQNTDVARGAMDTGHIAREITALTSATVSQSAIAAGIARLVDAQAGPGDRVGSPWSARDGFQLSGPRRLTLPFVIDGSPANVEARWDGSSAGAMILLDGVAASGASEAAAHVHVVVAGTEAFVVERGAHVRIARPLYDATVEDDGDGSGRVKAPINGRVAKVFVSVGDTVEKGASVAVVEAMKMEHVLAAPIAGRVDSIAAAEGAQVVQGAVIVSITEV